MNMRMPPAQIRSALPDPDDAVLDRLCRAAIKALLVDLQASEAHWDGAEAAEANRPLYPATGPLPPSRSGPSASHLKAEFKKHNIPGVEHAQWRRQQRAAIRAAIAWERQVRAVDRTFRIAALDAAHTRAVARSRNAVQLVADRPARTAYGMACKAAVFESWMTAGYAYHDEGLALVESILHDARMVGTDGNSSGLMHTSRGVLNPKRYTAAGELRL